MVFPSLRRPYQAIDRGLGPQEQRVQEKRPEKAGRPGEKDASGAVQREGIFGGAVRRDVRLPASPRRRDPGPRSPLALPLRPAAPPPPRCRVPRPSGSGAARSPTAAHRTPPPPGSTAPPRPVSGRRRRRSRPRGLRHPAPTATRPRRAGRAGLLFRGGAHRRVTSLPAPEVPTRRGPAAPVAPGDPPFRSWPVAAASPARRIRRGWRSAAGSTARRRRTSGLRPVFGSISQPA